MSVRGDGFVFGEGEFFYYPVLVLVNRRSVRWINSEKYLLLIFVCFLNFWVCVLEFEFVFLVFLFKTHLDLNSYDF